MDVSVNVVTAAHAAAATQWPIDRRPLHVVACLSFQWTTNLFFICCFATDVFVICVVIYSDAWLVTASAFVSPMLL